MVAHPYKEKNGEFVAHLRQKNLNMLFIYSIINTEALIFKAWSISLHLFKILVVEVDFMKAKLLHSRLFSKLCEEMNSKFEYLFLGSTLRVLLAFKREGAYVWVA